MSSVIGLWAHLLFNGVANEAIDHYAQALDATVAARMFWRDMPGGGAPEDKAGWVMHSRLIVGKNSLLVADDFGGPDAPPKTNGTLMIEFNDAADMAKKFEALAVGGKVLMPIHDAFWGAKFGQLVDKFGVPWMFHCESKPAA
ncbi:MAG: VOC family protein [Polyangiaceae bacterium]|nr:VOC family protein [Polyangiaceae bacterium]